MTFTGQTILITGATSGIGLELAKALQALGNKIIIAGRREALLTQITATHPGMVGYRLDMADGADIARFASAIVSNHPDLNVVIHNAGIMIAEELSATPSDLAVSEATIATNLLGPIRLTHALLPHLAALPEAAIVTVSSGLAFVPLALAPTYSATKAAIHSWSQSLRHQLAETPIKVLEIAPPGVQTDLMPGHAVNPQMMPLADFITETVERLQSQPTPDEVLVERVKFLRNAEREGRFDQVFAMLNGAAH